MLIDFKIKFLILEWEGKSFKMKELKAQIMNLIK